MSRIGKKPIPLPKGVTFKVEGNVVSVQGPKGRVDTPLPAGIKVQQQDSNLLALREIDRQKVGQVAAEMRSLRPPDPYKNKGVRYVGERLKKKVGKTGAK